MKKEKCRCPGCSRHCCLDAPRCKYGCRYCQKSQPAEKKTKKHKWRQFVQADGALAQLIDTGRRARKALARGEAVEAQLLASLSPEEQESLRALLEKLNAALPRKVKKHV